MKIMYDKIILKLMLSVLQHFDAFMPSAQKYVPPHIRNKEKSQILKQMEFVIKNKDITEELASKYLYSRKREILTSIPEDVQIL